MDRRVCHGLTRCFHLRCSRTSLGYGTACRLSAERNARSAIILGVMDRRVCHGLTRCFHLRCSRTSLGDGTACRLSAERNTRSAITKLSVRCAEDSSLAPRVPQQAKWMQVCQSTQSGSMNSGCNSWPDYPKFLGVIFGRDATVCIYNSWVRRLRA